MTEPSQVPPYRYTAKLAEQIELAWQDRWEREGTFHAANPVGALSAGFDGVKDRPRYYTLDMFPYPSGVGLHVGHPLGYIGTDVFARYLRMTGHNVLHTMGYDAFGLPAEQFAVDKGQHPQVTTAQNIDTMRRQLRRLGLGHDSRRSLATTDVSFYRWTQWIFLQIFNSWYDTALNRARPIMELIAELEAGKREPARDTNPYGRPWSDLSERERREVVNNHRLAYLHEAPVNWCPGLGTVLANEEVTSDGRSERGNFPVFRRPLKQWMLRITAYAERLLADLDRLDWPDSVKLMQRNWIGRSRGASIHFESPAGPIEVFTTRPDTIFGATYLVVAPEHPMVSVLSSGQWESDINPLWTAGASSPVEAVTNYQQMAAQRSEMDRQTVTKTKTGVFTGSWAKNPVNNARIPIFIADYVLMGYGTGAIMAVPGEDERDWEFAESFDLPIVRTVQPPPDWTGKAYQGDGPTINSEFLNGLSIEDAKRRIIEWLEGAGAGQGTVTYRLRDWLFSRQRYWGEPFPVVYDAEGLPHALPESMLPVELPEVDDFAPAAYDANDATSEPEPPLGRARAWAEVLLDLGEGPQVYRREVNTMPQWAGSCWYELRYLDPTNEVSFVDTRNEQYWMGPHKEGDVGGVDLYVGGVEHAVLHLLYARFWHKVLHDLGYVSSAEPFRRLVNQGYVQAYAYTDERGFYVPAAEVVERNGTFYWNDEVVTQEYGKMGKSLKNAVTPDEMYELYGADTLRLYEMFTGPLDQSRPWETKDVVGSARLLQRVWRNIIDEQTGSVRVTGDDVPTTTLKLLHRTIAYVRDGIENMRFNIAIARITELNNHLTQAYPHGIPRSVAEPLVLMLAPLAPHIAEELWARLGHAQSLTWERFPEADPTLLTDDMVTIPVQINGKVRGTVQVPAGSDDRALEAAAQNDQKIAAQLAGRDIRKVIVVPGRLVNFVVPQGDR